MLGQLRVSGVCAILCIVIGLLGAPNTSLAEEWDDLSVLQINREPPRATVVNYPSVEMARSGGIEQSASAGGPSHTCSTVASTPRRAAIAPHQPSPTGPER